MFAKFNIMLLGGDGSGKTAVVNKYFYNRFANYYEPSTSDCYIQEVAIGDSHIKINVTDCIREDGFTFFRNQCIKQAEGFIIVHPINIKNIHKDVEELIELIYRTKEKEEDIPMVVAGNKKDLENERQINKEEVEEKCNDKGIPYIECSAKTGEGITEVFETLIKMFIEIKTQEKNKAKKTKKQTKGCLIN